MFAPFDKIYVEGSEACQPFLQSFCRNDRELLRAASPGFWPDDPIFSRALSTRARWPGCRRNPGQLLRMAAFRSGHAVPFLNGLAERQQGSQMTTGLGGPAALEGCAGLRFGAA